MNANPFSQIPLPPKASTAQNGLSRSAATALLANPSTTSPIGLRDLAILRLLANGLTLRQIHKLNLQDVNETQGVLVVPQRNGKPRVVILETADQTVLLRWLTVRRLFANQTEAVFISLHWTAGRADPGQRLSERGIRLAVDKHLRAIGEKIEGVSCAQISKVANYQKTDSKKEFQNE
jgi:site-specific recombinase XerD